MTDRPSRPAPPTDPAAPGDRRTAGRAFHRELEIAAPAAAVWRALADADELVRWFAPEATIDARPGGEVTWRWPGIAEWPQRVELVEAGRRLRTTYPSAARGDAAPLFVDFTVDGRGGSTTLRLVHSGFGPDADFDAELDGISRGWPVELEALRLYLERHRGRPRRIAAVVIPVDQPLDAAWARLCAADCLGCGTAIDRLVPGQGYAFTTAAGERFAGEVLHCNPRELGGRDHAHGDGFLRATVEHCAGKNLVWVSLSTWGDAAESSEVQSRLEQAIRPAFAAAGKAR